MAHDYNWNVFLEEVLAVCEVSYGGVSMQDCLKMTFDKFTDLVNKVNEVRDRHESEMKKAGRE